jgi:hypothetical protein
MSRRGLAVGAIDEISQVKQGDRPVVSRCGAGSVLTPGAAGAAGTGQRPAVRSRRIGSGGRVCDAAWHGLADAVAAVDFDDLAQAGGVLGVADGSGSWRHRPRVERALTAVR